jgi:serine/threonine protein kinase
MADACPDTEKLRHLLDETLIEAEQARVMQHLDACGECRGRLEWLAGGVEWIAKAAQGTVPVSPRLGQVMKYLAADNTVRVAAASVDQALAPGATLRYFGDYEIMEELGRGGMGVVYKARQVNLNRTVALKLILAGQLASLSEVRRFRTEAEAAAMLDHTNIVPIHEIGEHEGRHYFSMKLVEGPTLGRVIENCKLRIEKLPIGRGQTSAAPDQFQILNSQFSIAHLMTSIARAVHYAHQRGVLHRDLKPSNILLDARGEPHLTDFGLAKMLERDSGMTHSAAIMGTPNYLAPELAAGKIKEVTTAADVYSLGAILYELLAGRPPFHEETVAATLDKVRHAEPPSPLAVNPAVPRDLATICLKCLEKDPMRRYRSALELAKDLERFTRGEPITARPVTHAERVWRWCHRQPALAVTLTTLCIVLGLGIAGMLWQWSRAEAAKAQLAEALGSLPSSIRDSPARDSSLPHTASVENRPQASSTASFVIQDSAGSFVRAFPDINQAIRSAHPGALIECRFTGEWPIEAIDLAEKPLIIRAVANTKPAFVITRRPGPLLRTRAPLVLEGLTFKVPALESRPSLSPYHSLFNEPVIESSNAPLWMANCRIEMVGPLGGPLGGGCCVGLLDNSFATFENCEFYAPINGGIVHLHTAQSLGTASGPDRIIVRNCVQTGFSFVHPKNPRGFELLIELTRNSIAIGSCAVGFTEPPEDTPVTVAATQNVFDVDYVVGSQPPARLKPAERLLRWIDATNMIHVKEGFTRTRPALTTAEQWQSFVGGSGGGRIPVGLGLSDRIMTLRTDMNQFTPERFLLSAAEKEQLERTVPGLSQALGVQPEICGPGEPYDRWRRSPAYVGWQKEVNRLFFEKR